MTPTIDTLINAIGGKPSRDGASVVVSFGPIGYLRVTPATVTIDGAECPAARIDGRLARANGQRQAELRDKLRVAGIEIR